QQPGRKLIPGHRETRQINVNDPVLIRRQQQRQNIEIHISKSIIRRLFGSFMARRRSSLPAHALAFPSDSTSSPPPTCEMAVRSIFSFVPVLSSTRIVTNFESPVAATTVPKMPPTVTT